MTAVVVTVAGIAIVMVSFTALAWWALWYFTRDTGTHAAPRHQRAAWDEPAPEWLPAPEWPPPVAHEEDWQTAVDERHSGVIVADVYTPSEWREPFAAWESDTFVGGMLAITTGDK